MSALATASQSMLPERVHFCLPLGPATPAGPVRWPLFVPSERLTAMAGANTPTWPMHTKGGDVAGADRGARLCPRPAVSCLVSDIVETAGGS
jgi:hypothetical protein